MSLTTKSRVEKYLLTSINTSFDVQLAEWIQAADDHINKSTDRQIIADTVDATYKYSGLGKDYMMIDDFIAVTLIEMDGTDITDKVFLDPVNRLPYFKMSMEDDVFLKGKHNVHVTGRRGYAALANAPQDLVFAATVFVAGIVNFSNNSSGEIKSESIGRYTVSYSTTTQKEDYERAESIIKMYRRKR